MQHDGIGQHSMGCSLENTEVHLIVKGYYLVYAGAVVSKLVNTAKLGLHRDRNSICSG